MGTELPECLSRILVNVRRNEIKIKCEGNFFSCVCELVKENVLIHGDSMC